MLNGNVLALSQTGKPSNPFATVIRTSILSHFANDTIKKYNSIGKLLIQRNMVNFNLFAKNGQLKTWLGVICGNFNRGNSTNDAFEYLEYTGGMIIFDFIIGFNFNKNKFITDHVELTEKNTLQLNTPLLNTQMYLIKMTSLTLAKIACF
jgi:hypothetical protein